MMPVDPSPSFALGEKDLPAHHAKRGPAPGAGAKTKTPRPPPTKPAPKRLESIRFF
jgi:hypothetical protein